MTTLKSSVSVAGQVISNNDPQMVITLDPHAGVQISSIQDDSITYEFKGNVTAEALYNLNLTFTYQGRYQVKVPCTFKQTVVARELHVEWLTTEEQLVGAETNNIKFKVTDAGGLPVTGVTAKSVDVKSTPYNPGVSPGSSKNIGALTNPGEYECYVNLGHLAGSIAITLTLLSDGVEYPIAAKSYAVKGTPIKTSVDTPELLTTDGGHTVTVYLKQDKFNAPDSLVDGKISTFAVTGGATSASVAPFNATNGEIYINILPNGTLENVLINATLTEADGGFPRPVVADIVIKQDTLVLATVGATALTPVTASNLPQFQVRTSKGVALTGVTSSKISIKGEPSRGIVVGNKTRIFDVAGKPTDHFFDVSIGHMPGELKFSGTFTYKGLEYPVIVPITYTTVGTPMLIEPVPSSIVVNEDTAVEITFKQLRTASSVLTTVEGTLELQQAGPGMTIVNQFTAKAGSPGTFVGTVKGSDLNSTRQLKFTLVEDYEAFTHRWVDVMVDFSIIAPSASVTVDPTVLYNNDGPQLVELSVLLGGVPVDGTLASVAVTGEATTSDTGPLQISSGKVSITLDPTGVVGKATVSGTLTDRNSLPMGDFSNDIDVLQTPAFDMVSPSKVNLKVGEQKDIQYRAYMNEVPSARRIRYDEATSTIPRTLKVVSGAVLDDEVYSVTVEGVTNNNFGDLKLNWVIDDGYVDGPLGRVRFETKTTAYCLGYLGLKSVTPQVYVKTGDTVKIDLSLVIDNDEALSMLTEGIVVSSDKPAEVEIVGNVDGGFNIKSLWVPDQGMNTRTTNFTVTYLDQQVTFSVKVSHQSTNPSPISEVTGKIVGVGGDTGKMPVKVTSRMTPELDLTNAVTEWSVTTNDYISVSPDGTWTIKKDPETTASGTLRFSFRIPEQSMNWSDNVQVEYTIGNSTGPQITGLTNQYEMDLWDVSPLVFTITAEGVDVTSELTDINCINASEISAQYEFVKISDTSWGFKAIKSDPVKWQSNFASLVFKVTHDGKEFNLPAQVELSTRPNTTGIETQRFKVEAV